MLGRVVGIAREEKEINDIKRILERENVT